MEKFQPHYFLELFDSGDFHQRYERISSRWVYSRVPSSNKNTSYNGRFELVEYSPNNMAFKTADKYSHYAISSRLFRVVDFDHEIFIVQYHVKMQRNLMCGGAYIKLISQSDILNLTEFRDDTPYTIMFGPDKCGTDRKIHFIFRHFNITSRMHEEKAMRAKPLQSFDRVFDGKFHSLKLKIYKNNHFEILLDARLIYSGSLLEDFDPPVNPPKYIPDPNDRKPHDWDEREMIPDYGAEPPNYIDKTQKPLIPDTSAKKPSDWLEDEEYLILSPHSVKPPDWDDEADGEWMPDLIQNPKCENRECGPWHPPLIPNPRYVHWTRPLIKNPNYKGFYVPRTIPNPSYYYDPNPSKMTSIAAIGFELWITNEGVMFDNILVTSDEAASIYFEAVRNPIKHHDILKETIINTLRNRASIFGVVLVMLVLFMFVLVQTYLNYCRKYKQNRKSETNRHEVTSDVSPKSDEDPLSVLRKRKKPRKL